MPKAIAKVGKAVVGLVGAFIGAFGAAKLPKQQATQVPIKQSVAPRRSGFGRVKVGGVYALFESNDKTSVDVLALLQGRSQGFVQHYLDDDKVDVDAGTGGVWCPEDTRKYAKAGPPGDRTFIYTRLGLATETHYAQVGALIPAWDASHRGDGVTSLALICKQSKPKNQGEDFPNGVPAPSPVLDAQLLYDPRDEAQVQGDKSTYVYSRNPALQLLAYLTDAEGGMGLDYGRHIVPHLATWIATADDCDLAEATEAGTEPRYQAGGVYDHDSAPGDVIKAIVSTFDGFLAPAGDGGLVLRPGRYVAPTVTIRDRHVLAYSLQSFLPDEQVTNEYVVSFTDPDADYNKGDAGIVQDAADIAARGKVRSSSLELDWVQSRSQAVRLARRKLSRSVQPLRGTLTLNLYGLAVMGERYLQLEIDDNPLLADLVVEVTGEVKLDLPSLSLSFPFIAADAAIDDGDPGADVPVVPAPDPRPTPSPLAAPTIEDVTPLYEHASSSDTGARLQIEVTAPLDADVEWLHRWRVDGSTFWHEGASSDIDDGAAVTLLTGFVTANELLEVQVAYQTAGGVSPWSASFPIAVDAPTDDFEDAVAALTARIGSATSTEALSALDVCNLYASSGAKIRKADATDLTKPANCIVRAGFGNGVAVAYYLPGQWIPGFVGLTPGATYWLDTTAGAITTAPPAADLGHGSQIVGVADDAGTRLFFDPQPMNGI